MKNPDVLSSKIKKLRLELPQYSFSHSSAGDSTQTFVGRKRSVEKLQKLIEDDADKTGVYLITGNRGVGKTRLVNHVARLTSLQEKSFFFDNVRYLLLLLFAVAGVQFCLQVLGIPRKHPIILGIVSFGIFVLSFGVLCCFNTYNRKCSKRTGWKEFIGKGIPFAIEELSCLINPVYPYGMAQCLLKAIIAVSFTQFISMITVFTPIIVLIIALVVVLCYMFFRYRKINLHEYTQNNDKKKLSKGVYRFFQLKKMFLIPIWNYIKNHNRLYLRINFGHKLKDEKDILRLIARTLSTEYGKYRHSFRRMLPWRVMAFGLLLLFAYLSSAIVKEQEFYKSIKKTAMYNASSQMFLNDTNSLKNSTYYIIKDRERLGSAFSKASVMTDSLWLVTDQLIFEITKRAKKLPQYFWRGNVDLSKEFVCPIDYLFWLSFFGMYIFCILLFRCRWVMHFFVTHRIITQRLKRLNRDITHRTERENTIGINVDGKSSGIGSSIGTRTKRSRNVADAREIEKELQDILNDIQRIPVVACRPSLVIVFDELDKVEPGDADLERETPQTKASLFSINATRERQTEILRILSNMKYFLSTAQAKFIFIAGREMFDIHLADVSERNNYIGSIFNAVINVPSFLTDHPTGKVLREESSIASLPEEFVCRRLLPPPQEYPAKSYNLKSYRIYLEDEVYNYNAVKDNPRKIKQKQEVERKIQKIIAVLQQFIVYLAHVSKGAPKKMVQLFESFIEVGEMDKNKEEKYLVVQRYHSSRYFLSFSYYRQYTLGIIAYLMTPIFYRLAESNIKEHSDKLLVSSLRFVDFLFKFHKHSFTWKHLDISPELLEANHAPELKSVVVDLLNYLAQIHINKSSFSLYDYKFDSWIAKEIFTMTKTDEVFSALFSFSLDETLSLKKHYQDLLETAEREYRHDKDDSSSIKYIDAISSLQIVLGDLHFYDDELEVAAMYYKNAVEMIIKNESKDKDKKEAMALERLYLYVRNTLKLGMIHEKRKQYDFAYLTYGGICKRIIHERTFAIGSSDRNNKSFQKMTFEGLKQLYLPFIARLQMLELSHIGGITYNHLKQLEDEHKILTVDIDSKDASLLDADFYSRVADILYYKNSDLMGYKKSKSWGKGNFTGTNYSCTACYYYHKALYTLLNMKAQTTVIELLRECVEQIRKNYNMKYCTILARILSDWGNVFFSCDSKGKKDGQGCYICNAKDCDTQQFCYHCHCYICDYDDCETNNIGAIFRKYINYVISESEKENVKELLARLCVRYHFTKMELAFIMYSISSEAYRKANLYKRSAYQIYKMLRLFKHYESEKSKEYIKQLSRKAIHYLWYANEDLNVHELNKRKKDFDKTTVSDDDIIPLQSLLVDSEITKVRVLVKELELNASTITPGILEKYYGLYITSPYKINYSIGGRIYRLRLKSKVNYKAYQLLIYNKDYETKRENFWNKYHYSDKMVLETELRFILEENYCNETANDIFGEYFNINKTGGVTLTEKVNILDNLIADSIYSLTDIAQLTKTMGETYVFTNSFLGSVHEHLSFWIRLYETYELYKKKHLDIAKHSRVEEYLKQYLDEEWREQLSGYRETQRALAHYTQALEMHSEGRAYHDMIDTMCYVRDDYNDRSDHFNIAEERHLVVNGEIQKKIDALKGLYRGSKLYDPENYFGNG